MSRRRHKGKEPESSERWLITYADLITLLMVFFVIMYAMSKVDEVKFMSLSQSLAAALHKPDKIPLSSMGSHSLLMAANPVDQGNKTKTQTQTQTTVGAVTVVQDAKLDALYRQVQAYINAHNLENNVSISDLQRGVQITLKDVVLFDSGAAVIRSQAQGILRGLNPFFQQVPNPIVVEGYTDDQPIDTVQFPSNWELSSARAINVVRFLNSLGVQPQRLSGVGYGQYHNVEPNNSVVHRQENRRVNIVILREAAGTPQAQPKISSNHASALNSLANFASTGSLSGPGQ